MAAGAGRTAARLDGSRMDKLIRMAWRDADGDTDGAPKGSRVGLGQRDP
jgi:hypothetical protein